MMFKSEPDRPSIFCEPPQIKTVSTTVKTHGKYKTKSGMPRGLVVHYTAGRSHDGEKDAVNTLNGLAYRGLGCLVMSSFGVIYRAQNQAIDDVGYHAGESSYNGVSGLSRYCLGIEICCAGVVEQVGNKYASWFNELYYPSEVRAVENKDNYKKGFYHQFTREQESGLIALCRWQKSINPEFDYDWVIGHDECAPNRKLDPGGSLSMTMPEFRQMLKTMG